VTVEYVKEGDKPGNKWSPLLRGSLINRYKLLWDNDYWILYGNWLAAPRDKAIFEVPIKIMVRQTSDSIIASIIEGVFYARNNLHLLLSKQNNCDLRYILAIINSRLMDYCYSIMNPEKGEVFAEVKKQHVERLPIRPINFQKTSDKFLHNRMIVLVSSILEQNKKLLLAKTDQERISFQRQITAMDKQIDQLVYELYGLTEDEIKIVENAGT
jgi:adenine-specific DNA-methyltransferase